MVAQQDPQELVAMVPETWFIFHDAWNEYALL
jgi:hypothetical protein